MHVALDRTLILLIDHKELMFQFIDYMDHNRRKDLPTQFYTNSLRAKLDRLPNKADIERLSDAFDLTNLIKTDIVSEFNRSRGTIAFQPAIIELFRLFDKGRVRALKSAELENIRVQLDNSYQQHQKQSFSYHDADFLEQRDQLLDLLRQINSQIQNNTAHLQHKADHLSSRLDYDPALLSLDSSQQIKEALLEVKNIFDREIIPLLEFLNSREQSKNKMPLSLIDALSKLYEIKGNENDSYYIDQYKLSILSHYKVIEKVKLTLQRYLHQERHHRLTYNALEQSYLHLQTLAKETFTEKLNDKYIFKPLSKEKIFFAGLKSHAAAQDASLAWFDHNHAVCFNEYLINQKARKRSDKVAEVTKVNQPLHSEPSNALKRKIKTLISQSPLPPPIDDLYASLHALLSTHFSDDYQLQYLLYAASCFKHKRPTEEQIKVHFRHPPQQLHYKGAVLEYNKREVLL
jgi:hypothetical protein